MANSIRKVNKLPKGFKKNYRIQTAPLGYYGADNGESYFSGRRQTVFVKERWAKTPQEMTKKELAQELYTHYRRTGSTPIGSKEPLTEKEFVRRHLKGIGGVRGFSKSELEQMVTRERNGTGTYHKRSTKHIKPGDK